jgi:hypothetical protein
VCVAVHHWVLSRTLHDSNGCSEQQQEPGLGTSTVCLCCMPDHHVAELLLPSPLSQGHLPTLLTVLYTQEHLATPETRFMPSCFRVVAALASCPTLRAVYMTPSRDTAHATGHVSSLNLQALDKWAMWKVGGCPGALLGTSFDIISAAQHCSS